MAARIEAVAPKDAIAAYEARRGHLVETFHWQDFWEEEHADRLTVAKSAGFDILKDIDAALLKAISEGQTLREFSRELTPILQAKGWWGRQIVTDPLTEEEVIARLGSPRRLKTIFETNMRVSYAAGHWASFERNKKARPYLRYVAIMDERTRPAHAALHNLVLPVDHPFWKEFAPPNGWGCRCALQSLSERDVKRLQRDGEVLQFKPPKITTRNFVNRRTGEVTKVPDGIDPGWSHNPGQAGYRALKLADKLIDAPADLAAAFNDMPDWLQKPIEEEFAKWFDVAAEGGPIDQPLVVTGALSRDVLAALRERGIDPQSGAISVSQRTVRHIIRDLKTERGRAVPTDLLRRIPSLLSEPKAVLLDKRDKGLLYVFDLPGRDSKGKLVVRMGYQEKVRQAGSKPEKIRSNSIRTAGTVASKTLQDRATYDLLFGEL